MSDIHDGERFGELLGLIEFRGLSPEDAIDVAVEAFGGDRETYESLVEDHWQ